MRRRKFITLLGGAAAAAWPLAARAQQNDRMRRIGVLMSLTADDPEGQPRLAAFRRGLQDLGWTEGRNLQIDVRWGTGDAALHPKYAADLVALAPDVILAAAVPVVRALQQASRTVPIVFAQAVDPVGAGVVASLARPGASTTGFMSYDYSLSGKWLELLKDVAPRVTRAAIVRDSYTVTGIGQWAVIQAMASPVAMELSPVEVRDAGEIERDISAFARGSGGLIVTVGGRVNVHRELIIALAARHKLPAVYNARYFVTGGGLISYGPDYVDQYRRAAGYVDRILKGEKPGELPVQAPTKYELAINLKTAKVLGLTIPPTLLARADEVIE